MAAVDKNNYWEYQCTAEGASLPANLASVVLLHVSKFQNKSILTSDDYVRNHSSGLIDKDGNVLSGTASVANYAALPAAASNTGVIYRINDLGLEYVSDGTYWIPQNKSCLYGKSTGLIAVTVPAATFTGVTATNLSPGIRLVGAGAHVLTTAVAVGKKIYVSAGTNWTPGFYTITALDADSTGVRIDLAENFVTGMGSPTIALASTTNQIPVFTKTVHPLTPNSSLDWDCTVENIDSATVKRIIINYGAFEAYNINQGAAGNIINRNFGAINNMGATNLQRTSHTTNTTSGVGTSTATSGRNTQETNASLTFGVYFVIAVANTWMELTQFKLTMSAA